MSTRMRYILNSIGVILLSVSTLAMLYFGYKTFYIDETDAEVTNDEYHFALIAQEEDLDYWRQIEKGAREAAEENDIYLDYIAPQKADNDEALVLLDKMISAKVDGIMTHGIEGEQFVDLVHKGIERGIPIITIDSDVESSERKAYVGFNNYEAGQLLGEAIIEGTTGQRHIGIIIGRYDAIDQQERMEGVKDALASASEHQIVAAEESNFTEVGAARAAYTLLKDYPDITIVAGLGALDGVGAVDGLQDIAPTKDIFIAAFDALPRTIQSMKDNKIDVTMAQNPEKIGYKAIEVMLDLQEKDLLENRIYIDTEIIHKESLQNNHENGGE